MHGSHAYCAYLIGLGYIYNYTGVLHATFPKGVGCFLQTSRHGNNTYLLTWVIVFLSNLFSS